MLALILGPKAALNMSMYGPDHHFQRQGLDVVRCYLHPVVGVNSSV